MLELQELDQMQNEEMLRQEQRLMSGTGEETGTEQHTAKTAEGTGYSSDFYRWQMENALSNDSRFHPRYTTVMERPSGSELSGTAEGTPERDREASAAEGTGYSSDYYKWQMENAVKSGSSIAYENAKRNYAKAVVREST